MNWYSLNGLIRVCELTFCSSPPTVDVNYLVMCGLYISRVAKFWVLFRVGELEISFVFGFLFVILRFLHVNCLLVFVCVCVCSVSSNHGMYFFLKVFGNAGGFILFYFSYLLYVRGTNELNMHVKEEALFLVIWHSMIWWWATEDLALQISPLFLLPFPPLHCLPFPPTLVHVLGIFPITL